MLRKRVHKNILEVNLHLTKEVSFYPRCSYLTRKCKTNVSDLLVSPHVSALWKHWTYSRGFHVDRKQNRSTFLSLKLSLVSEENACSKSGKEQIVSKSAVLLVMIPRIWESSRLGRSLEEFSLSQIKDLLQSKHLLTSAQGTYTEMLTDCSAHTR